MSTTLDDLPEDVRREIEGYTADFAAMLNTIGIELAAKRDEAVAHRSTSGVEDAWREAEEAYIGIDDANRGEFRDGRWSKPMSMNAPLTTDRQPINPDYRSTAYLRLTARYVDAGSAKLGEILFPADDKAFSLNAMPAPSIIHAKDDESQVVHDETGMPLTRPAGPGDPPPAATPPLAPQAGGGSPAPTPAPVSAPPAAPRVPLTVKDLAIENIEMAQKKAKAAETRIYDWMVATNYRAEGRKLVSDAARIGVAVLKAPTPSSKRVVAGLAEGNGLKVIIKETIIPAALRVDPWNIFPDPACGDNVHNGDHLFERDYMSARQVRGLKKLPGYIAGQIDKVLAEGPKQANQPDDGRQTPVDRNKGRFEVWYFHGTLTREEMAAIAQCGCDTATAADDAEEVYAIVTLINESVVRAVLNPLDTGSLPYHSMPWQAREGSWAGIGVAEQMRTAQRITNAALRAMLNNAGQAAGAQIVMNRAAIEPANGQWTITPGKLWFTTDESPDDVRKAFATFIFPSLTDELMKIIEMGERFAEETTSIPLITQGQSGATTPDTFGAAQLQNNNANQLLRSIGYSFDDCITEPVVNQYYEWLLLDPEVPNEEKGEFQVDAHGSIALVERAIQDHSIAQMGGMAANPIYGIDPKKWSALFLKSKRLDPDQVMYTEAEQAKIDAAPPPEQPAVTVAKINADTQLKLGVMKQQGDATSIQSEEKIAAAANALEGARVTGDQQQAAADTTVRLHEVQTQLDAVKAQLAKTAMQLQTERELNAQNLAAADRKHRREMQARNMPKPPVQAPGRARNGQAFSQSGAP